MGIVIGLKDGGFRLNKINIFYFLFVGVSIVLAGIFVIIINNFADINIDKISNKNRPLITKEIDEKSYLRLSIILLIMSLAYAAIVSLSTVLVIVIIIINYWIYSMKPLRLKRFLIVSKLVISGNSLALVLLGYHIIERSLSGFPLNVVIWIIVFFTLAINFIDIKDYEGDKKEGIKTLPVAIGLKNSKRLIGVFFIIAYLSVYLIIREIYLVFLFLIMGILQYYLINKKDYDERYVFIVYLASVILFILVQISLFLS
jgi:4-hydroxybenzoate polyprenyltransferase